MNTLDDLIPYVQIDIPQCPENMIRLKIREAIRRFCRETEAWTQEIVVDAVDSQADYDVYPEGDAFIQRIMYVKLKSSDNDSFDDMKPIRPDRYKLDKSNFKVSFYNNKWPLKSITDGMQVGIALRPTFEVENLDGDFVDRYGEGIYSMAKYLIMSAKGKPYSDPNQSIFHLTEYRSFAADAVREKYTENKNVTMRVRQLGGIL